MDWDEERDVVCVGAGIGGLAVAIVAADVDADVLIAGAGRFEDGRWSSPPSVKPAVRTLGDFVRSWTDTIEPTAEVEGDEPHEPTAEEATAGYFAALIEELVPTGRVSTPEVGDATLSVRRVREPSDAEDDPRRLETFDGRRLVDWTQRCLESAAGALFTTVRGWTSTTMKDITGQTVRIAPVDAVRAGIAMGRVFDSLVGAVATREIAVSPQSTLRSVVLEGGRVTGVVLNTPDGRWAVRARHSVVFSPDFTDRHETIEGAQGSDDGSTVAIVGSPASRFSCVELVVQ